jgi:membrane associated rhomboid family serine protease
MYNQQPFNLTPVVKNLLIINVVVFVVTKMILPNVLDPNMLDSELASGIAMQHPNWSSANISEAMISNWLAAHLPTSFWFKPFQILTHMFMHGNLLHIFMNMLGIVMFGPMIEAIWQEQRFLMYYLLCGLGAMLCQWAMFYYLGKDGSIVGASGCLFGLMVALAWHYPNAPLGFLFLPFSMPAKYAVVVFVALESLFGVTSMKTGVAHIAHYGGALTGALLILLWYRNYK